MNQEDMARQGGRARAKQLSPAERSKIAAMGGKATKGMKKKKSKKKRG